jgi:hypothetical protein
MKVLLKLEMSGLLRRERQMLPQGGRRTVRCEAPDCKRTYGIPLAAYNAP